MKEFVGFVHSVIRKHLNENKVIINEIEIDEAIYPSHFDMGKFKSLKTFKERVEYCNQNLKKLGSGSARIVYLIDNVTVLKLAKNQKGLAQNEVESDYSEHLGSTVAKVLDREQNYLWIESEFAKKVSPSRFTQLTGFNINDVNAFIKNYENQYKGKRPIFSMDSRVESVMWEDEFISGLRDIVDNGLSAGDLGRITSYGELNNEIKVIDYGLNDDVYDSYYKR
jgi:hypothetical protein